MVVGIGESVKSLPVLQQYETVRIFAGTRPSCSVLLLTSVISVKEVKTLEDALQTMPKLNFFCMRRDAKVDVAAQSSNLLPAVKRLYKLGLIARWAVDADGTFYRRYIRDRSELCKVIGVETVAKNHIGALKNQKTSLGGVIENIRETTPAEAQRYLISQGSVYEIGYACNGHKKKEIVVEIRY